jgi:hypothetical protein
VGYSPEGNPDCQAFWDIVQGDSQNEQSSSPPGSRDSFSFLHGSIEVEVWQKSINKPQTQSSQKKAHCSRDPGNLTLLFSHLKGWGK